MVFYVDFRYWRLLRNSENLIRNWKSWEFNCISYRFFIKVLIKPLPTFTVTIFYKVLWLHCDFLHTETFRNCCYQIPLCYRKEFNFSCISFNGITVYKSSVSYSNNLKCIQISAIMAYFSMFLLTCVIQIWNIIFVQSVQGMRKWVFKRTSSSPFLRDHPALRRQRKCWRSVIPSRQFLYMHTYL
jgi:hypothetical protein